MNTAAGLEYPQPPVRKYGTAVPSAVARSLGMLASLRTLAFKQIIFQLHWLLGITAGTVLAIMGVSGAVLSFEDEILDVIDPSVLYVPARAQPLLSPDELVARIEAASGERVVYIFGHAQKDRSVRIRFQPPPGERRGADWYFDPYTGAALGQRPGKAFFEFIERLHRYLAAGERGKAITGIAVLGLVFFCISGLYLRWPRRALDWRSWVTLDLSRRGRSLFWELHSVIGTWCLLFYLLIALTGLYWSYDWYRQGLERLLADQPATASSMGAALPPANRAVGANILPPVVDYAAIWQAVREAAGPQLGSYNLRLPNAADQPITVSYLLGPAQDRLHEPNQLRIDPRTATVLQHTLFAEKSVGAKLLANVYALHVGEYFGLIGRVLIMIASLCMPLFFVTGWLLYLDRRKKKREIQRARGQVAATGNANESWLVGFASQSGFAEQLAWQSAGHLQLAGHAVQVKALAQIDAHSLRNTRNALFVVSTFGDGEPPDGARGFMRNLLGRDLELPQLRYGLLALGDRQYQSFCGFARQLGDWLQQQGAGTLFAPVEVDNADQRALLSWQQQLARLTGVAAVARAAPAFERWLLVERHCLNPHTQGALTFLLNLQPPPNAVWHAGDVLEILPCHAIETVRAFIATVDLDPGAQVSDAGQKVSLFDALKRRELIDDPIVLRGLDAQSLLEKLRPLAAREYSIASVADDGRLELIVRQARRHDDRIGVGSGWLTLHAAPYTHIEARVRRNSSFHAPADGRRLILIGNGTGLAGLRSLLKAREQTGHGGNWLIFGERNAAHDYYCRAELEHWLAEGHLARLDLAFSRDQTERIYVQHRLRAAASQLREWVAAGAAIYVCGSLQGMAGGVDRVLREVLGTARVDELTEQGHYRRDVY